MSKLLTRLVGVSPMVLPGFAAAQVYDDYGAASAGAGLFFGIFGIVWMVLGLGLFVFWIYMLVDAIRRQFPNPNDKILWIVVIVILGALGALIYLLMGRSKGTLPGASSTPSTPPAASGPAAPAAS